MFYASNPFDRADQIRKDDVEIERLWQSDTTRVVPYHLGKLPISTTVSGEPIAVTINSFDNSHALDNYIFLGFRDSVAYFACDFSHLEDASEIGLPDDIEFQELRVIGPTLAPDDGAMLAYTRAMIHWQQQTLHCAICGHKNSSRNAGHVKVCTNTDCARETFPRTDPAVIMLVIDQSKPSEPDRCLLGRHPAWPEGVYSTLAGFVEPGETLESAVIREVFEEAGIIAEKASYVASQPWPFPQSIMLGFKAYATTTDITIDPTELADAQWFTKAELATFGNWGDDNYKQQLPRPDSIARHLIDSWVKQK